MVDVVLTDEQVRTVESCPGAVRLMTADGRVLAVVGTDPEVERCEVAEVLESLKRPVRKWYSTPEVLEHLARLTPQ